MADPDENQKQIEADQQAEALRMAEQKEIILKVEHAELAEVLRVYHAKNLSDSQIQALKLAQIEHNRARLEADIQAMKEVMEQLPLHRKLEARLAGKRF